MIFIEFTLANPTRPNTRYLFVGASLKDVLEDTAGGKHYGGEPLSTHREVTAEEIHPLVPRNLLDHGIEIVERSGSGWKCVFLGSLQVVIH